VRRVGPRSVPGGSGVVGAVMAMLAASAALAGCATNDSSKPTATSKSSVSKSVSSTTATSPCAARSSHTVEGTAQMTVDPGTCLKGGEVVGVTGSGLKPNSPGGLAECNSAEKQPTIAVEGSQVPVSCTSPLARIVSTSSRGTLKATFKIVTGYTGPPSTGTDSARRSDLKDAHQRRTLHTRSVRRPRAKRQARRSERFSSPGEQYAGAQSRHGRPGGRPEQTRG